MRIVNFHDLSSAISFESNTPAVAEVAVCATRSLLTHTMVSPEATVSACGLNCMPSMVTVWVFGRVALPAVKPMDHNTRDSAAATVAVRMPV